MSRSHLDIDLGAVAANVAALRDRAGGVELCAVVKADGYGHGAVPIARTALEAGATVLAVAQVGEGVALRAAGIDASIWILAEPAPDEWPAVADHRLEPALYSPAGIEAATAAASSATGPATGGGSGGRDPVTVHLAVDTGMGRVGATVDDAATVARRIAATPSLRLGSVWTHLAAADDPEHDATTAAQLTRYDRALAAIAGAGIDVARRHAANSAGAIAHPGARYDLVRCGIAIYGLPPSPELDGVVDLRPALTWRTTVAFVKRVPAGTPVSYGHRERTAADTTLATIPVGYADGLRRAWWREGAVLIGGRRRPIRGVVTMDQTIVDCGDDPVRPGDEVVLIGSQGAETISATEVAAALDTINYEITCAIGQRVERRYAPNPERR